LRQVAHDALRVEQAWLFGARCAKSYELHADAPFLGEGRG
jgi:hypothetical protein